LVYISFQTEKEAKTMMKYISAHPMSAELQIYLSYDGKQRILLKIEAHVFQKIIELLSDTFQVFIKEEWMLYVIEQIIREKFLFKEREEIDQILDIASSIMEGERFSKTVFWEEAIVSIKEGLQSIAENQLSFSFESFVKFRLRKLNEMLIQYVEHAIDEYKLEQDYQSFIYLLRNFMINQTPKMNILHILHRETFEFYNEAFEKMGKQELMRLIDRKLLAENPLYIDSNVIAPLISIAPNELLIYTESAENGIIQTIQRIFEERSKILSLDQFYSSCMCK
jgi:putative sporulation protein YtxC